MQTTIEQDESRARRLAKKQKFVLRKSRSPHRINERYMVVDPYFNTVVYFSPDIEGVIGFLS